MKKALIVWGGWDGHTPREAAELFDKDLKAKGWDVRVEDNLSPLADVEYLKTLDLITPIWTMGQMTPEQGKGLDEAVKSGVGLGGFHGGMGDAFRGNLGFEWMVGGLFVGHPHVGKYTVRLTKKSPITSGLKKSFTYESEQYYMMTDPGNNVLATTTYKHAGSTCVMPVIWTKKWGKGRVFYSALGHSAAEFVKYPDVRAMTVAGMLWAAAGKNK